MNPEILFEAIEISLSRIVRAVHADDGHLYTLVLAGVEQLQGDDFVPLTNEQALKIEAILAFSEGIPVHSDPLKQACLLRSSILGWMARDGWMGGCNA